MSTTPAPHEGMGVTHYAWSSSPLRRYVDLVNQRQLIAAVADEPPPYAANDAELFAVVSAFDVAYSAYAAFQTRMERYWCLRWLEQEQVARIGATVLKEDLLRIDGLPFVTRMPGMPVLPRGQRVELDLLGSDEIELTLEARLHQVLTAPAASEEELDAEEESEELAQPQALGLGFEQAEGRAQGPAQAEPETAPDQSNRESGVAS
jgi:exoribonuclease-2